MSVKGFLVPVVPGKHLKCVPAQLLVTKQRNGKLDDVMLVNGYKVTKKLYQYLRFQTYFVSRDVSRILLLLRCTCIALVLKGGAC